MTTEKNEGRCSGKSATQCVTTSRKCIGNSADAQRARLLNALEKGPLTTLQVRRDLGILAPAPRVHELRHRQGKTITTVWVDDQADDGSTHRVALYVLQPDAQLELDTPVGGSA